MTVFYPPTSIYAQRRMGLNICYGLVSVGVCLFLTNRCFLAKRLNRSNWIWDTQAAIRLCEMLVLAIAVCSSSSAWQSTGLAKKLHTKLMTTILPNLADFRNSFTGRLCRKIWRNYGHEFDLQFLLAHPVLDPKCMSCMHSVFWLIDWLIFDVTCNKHTCKQNEVQVEPGPGECCKCIPAAMSMWILYIFVWFGSLN